MPLYTILFGVALMAVGVGTYIGAGEGASLTAFLLQMILGLLAIGLGVGSIVKKEMKMHLMHGALLLAAMGVIVPIFRFVLYLVQELDRSMQMTLIRMVLTVAFSAAFIFAGVQSFRAARRNRTDEPAAEPTTPQPQPDPAPDE